MSAPLPKLVTMETAESKLLKDTEASESFIKLLIKMPFGKDRSVMIQNLLLTFLGTTPIGDIQKFGNGGLVKGSDICFCISSSDIQLKIAVGFEEAECKLGAILQNSGPE